MLGELVIESLVLNLHKKKRIQNISLFDLQVSLDKEN